MSSIVSSAAKIVFIVMALAMIGLTAFGIIDPKDFVAAAMMAFTFYFSNKGDSSQQYLGK